MKWAAYTYCFRYKLRKKEAGEKERKAQNYVILLR